jgi:hypothetical protein
MKKYEMKRMNEMEMEKKSSNTQVKLKKFSYSAYAVSCVARPRMPWQVI